MSDARDVIEILNDSMALYERKNNDYGDSWRLVGKTIEMWLDHQDVDEVTIQNDPEVWNSLGLFTRRLDKIIREFNGWFVVNDGELKVDESIAETHEDDIPYAAMHAMLAEQYTLSNESSN